MALATAFSQPLPAAGQTADRPAGPPIPGHKPEPPPVPGSRPPAALAVPGAPSVAASVPARPRGGVSQDGGSVAIAPVPDFPAPPIPAPPPPIRDPATAEAPADPGPAPSAESPAVPTPPSMAALPVPPGLPDGRADAGTAPPPDPGPGPGVPAAEGSEFSVAFADDRDETLSSNDHALLSGIAARMARDQNARLELRAYASGTEETRREARRLSLMRAINVREFLVGQGVRSTRIDVRALGSGVEPPSGRTSDRVDLVLVN